MERLFAIGLAGIALMLPLAAAAQHDPAAHRAADAASAPQPAMTNGVVKKVDKAAGSLVIAHEPLKNLGMPGMTMSFRVKNPKWLDTVAAGTKIRFVAQEISGELTVVALEQV
jgi:Cu(I)/Ag(I) efflux system protein CusF